MRTTIKGSGEQVVLLCVWSLAQQRLRRIRADMLTDIDQPHDDPSDRTGVAADREDARKIR